MDGVVLEDGRTDAATRAELARLRRRAYGRGSDIESDPQALSRLIELEDAVLRERATEDPVAAEEPPAAASATGRPGSPVDAPSPAPPPGAGNTPGAANTPGAGDRSSRATPPRRPSSRRAPRRRTARRTPRRRAPRRRTPRRVASRREALIAAAAAAVLAVGLGTLGVVRALRVPETPPLVRSAPAPAILDARAAYSFAWDTDATIHLNIPLNGSFGRYIDLPTSGPVPDFPSTGDVKWVADLGRYFGWEVWIAGASVGETGLQREHCILVQRNEMTHSRCVPAAVRAQSALLVSVPFASMVDGERPVGMREGQRLGFWWWHERSVTVLVGDER